MHVCIILADNLSDDTSSTREDFSHMSVESLYIMVLISHISFLKNTSYIPIIRILECRILLLFVVYFSRKLIFK